ncbi:unnamed protein product [Timema podura]|uniref:C2 domain-containing protein n=1 Tax=Timema podura TaxID=61482 RepID=A0ABN7NHR4_TIMPD|nr:unnamed protein product [Timema podura]
MHSNPENKKKRQKKTKVDVEPGKSVSVIQEEPIYNAHSSSVLSVSKLKKQKNKATKRGQGQVQIEASKLKELVVTRQPGLTRVLGNFDIVSSRLRGIHTDPSNSFHGTLITYKIRTSAPLFHSYLQDCESLTLTLLDEQLQLTIGTVVINNLATIITEAPFGQVFSVINKYGNKVADLRLTFTLVFLSNATEFLHDMEHFNDPKNNIGTFTRNVNTLDHNFINTKSGMKHQPGKNICKKVEDNATLFGEEFKSPRYGPIVPDQVVASLLERGQRLRDAMLQSILDDRVDFNRMSESKEQGSQNRLAAYILGKNMTPSEENIILETLNNSSMDSNFVEELYNITNHVIQEVPNSVEHRESFSLESEKETLGHLTDRSGAQSTNDMPDVWEHVNCLKVFIENLTLSPQKNAALVGSRTTFFVEYELPRELLTSPHRPQRPWEQTKQRVSSNKRIGRIVPFNHGYTHTLYKRSEKLRYTLERCSVMFHVSSRGLNQRLPVSRGSATLSLSGLVQSHVFVVEQELAVATLGTLRVKVELGVDKVQFGRQLVVHCKVDSTAKKFSQSNKGVQCSSEVTMAAPEEKLVSEKPHKEPVLLHALLHVSDARLLDVASTHLVCRGFWKDDIISSEVCWESANPNYNLHKLLPVLLSNDLLERCRNNYLVCEVWQWLENRQHTLVGLCKLPLHHFYIAYRDTTLVPQLLLSKYPVVSIDGWLNVANPETGLPQGELRVLLAVGTEDQVQLLSITRGLLEEVSRETRPLPAKGHGPTRDRFTQINRDNVISNQAPNIKHNLNQPECDHMVFNQHVHDAPFGLNPYEMLMPVLESENNQFNGYCGVDRIPKCNEQLNNEDVFLIDGNIVQRGALNNAFHVPYKTNDEQCPMHRREMSEFINLRQNQLERVCSVEDSSSPNLSSGLPTAVSRDRRWNCRHHTKERDCLNAGGAKISFPCEGGNCDENEPTKQACNLQGQTYCHNLESRQYQTVETIVGNVASTARGCENNSDNILRVQSNVTGTVGSVSALQGGLFLLDLRQPHPLESTVCKQRNGISSHTNSSDIMTLESRDQLQSNSNTQTKTVPQDISENFSVEHISHGLNNVAIVEAPKDICKDKTSLEDISNMNTVNVSGDGNSLGNSSSEGNTPCPHKDPTHTSAAGGDGTQHGSTGHDDSQCFKARVEIDRALHLPPSDEHSLTSVMFQTAAGEIMKTNEVPYQVDPVWLWRCDTILPANLLQDDSKRLILKLWQTDGNGDETKHMIVGFAAVDLNILLYGLPVVSGWYNLMDFTGHCHGQIKVGVFPLEDLSRFCNDLQYTVSHPATEPEPSLPHCPGCETQTTLYSSLREKLGELDEITARLKQRLSSVVREDDGGEGSTGHQPVLNTHTLPLPCNKRSTGSQETSHKPHTTYPGPSYSHVTHDTNNEMDETPVNIRGHLNQSALANGDARHYSSGKHCESNGDDESLYEREQEKELPASIQEPLEDDEDDDFDALTDYLMEATVREMELENVFNPLLFQPLLHSFIERARIRGEENSGHAGTVGVSQEGKGGEYCEDPVGKRDDKSPTRCIVHSDKASEHRNGKQQSSSGKGRNVLDSKLRQSTVESCAEEISLGCDQELSLDETSRDCERQHYPDVSIDNEQSFEEHRTHLNQSEEGLVKLDEMAPLSSSQRSKTVAQRLWDTMNQLPTGCIARQKNCDDGDYVVSRQAPDGGNPGEECVTNLAEGPPQQSVSKPSTEILDPREVERIARIFNTKTS